MPENASQSDKPVQDSLLELHRQAFAKSLRNEGYAERTIQDKLRLLDQFGQWLKRTGLAVTNLDERLLKAFVKHKRGVRCDGLKTLRQFLDHLRKDDVVPPRKQMRDRSPWADILDRYEKHLHLERGLLTTTISCYLSYVRKFLVERFREGPFLLAEAKAPDISHSILRLCPGTGVAKARQMTKAFRSFFRFLFLKGVLQADLAASVLPIADWRRSTVPKYLTPEEVERVLEACDRRTSTGRRDYSILLLLARLGLRAGEVVALQLEDINWRAGELLVRGKGLLHDRMPLPADVGEALASYLRRGRPSCQTRRVFVCGRAPRRGFANTSTLSTIVRRALARAALHPPSKGAHLLRHSLATSMLRFGATMSEIGEVLRHRALSTTEIYAKVDFDGLRSLTHPWPMGGGQ